MGTLTVALQTTYIMHLYTRRVASDDLRCYFTKLMAENEVVSLI